MKLAGKDESNKDAKILIVDDCPFNIVALQSLLSQFDFESDHCTNGLDAVKKVVERKRRGKDDYKLIFMDFSMPGLDGPTATAMIRDLYKTEAKMAAQNTDSLLT